MRTKQYLSKYSKGFILTLIHRKNDALSIRFYLYNFNIVDLYVLRNLKKR